MPLTPLEEAQLLRDFREAVLAKHPVAAEGSSAGPLPPTQAADWFHRLLQGSIQCAHPPTPDQPPCTHDAAFAVTTLAQPEEVKMSCHTHLHAFMGHGVTAVKRLDSNPSRQQAASMQQAQRELQLQPAPAPELRRKIAQLKASLFPLDPLFHHAAQATTAGQVP